jgi:hypothetical protein
MGAIPEAEEVADVHDEVVLHWLGYDPLSAFVKHL